MVSSPALASAIALPHHPLSAKTTPLTPHKTEPTAIPEKALKIPWAPSSHPIHERSATP
ncbi:MAG: hypothetical protein AAFQ74_21310 [Cyanobacteria bacterium J06623_4]